jgi:hypothetical protein
MRSASEPLHKIAGSGFVIQFEIRQPRTPNEGLFAHRSPLANVVISSKNGQQTNDLLGIVNRSGAGGTCPAAHRHSTRHGTLQPTLHQ